MGLESPWQKVAVLGLLLGFLAVLVVALALVVGTLSDANARDLGHWLDENRSELWKGLVAIVPAIATYLLGRRAGRKVAKKEAYNSAIATVRGKPNTDEAAEALRDEARGHDLPVTA